LVVNLFSVKTVNKNEIAPRIIQMWEKKTSRKSKDDGELKRQPAVNEPLFTEARPVKVKDGDTLKSFSA
jgi:ribosomal protein L31E